MRISALLCTFLNPFKPFFTQFIFIRIFREILAKMIKKFK